MPVNDTTTNRSYQKPNIANTLADDVGRIRSALDAIDTDMASKAPLASPALTGTPTAPTAAADTNTTQVATTAFFAGQAGSASPLINGTATVGTSLRFSRQDHIHPTDTSRAPLASPTFTGVTTIAAGTATAPSLAFTGDDNTGLYSPGADQVAISTGGAERARIDSSGRLLVGTSASTSVSSVGYIGKTQIANSGNAGLGLHGFYNGALYGADIVFTKSNSNTIGTNTIVASGDELGVVWWAGANGTGYDRAASIKAEVDGTPGASNDMPGRLVFSTTADGASSPTERFRIANNGAWGLAGANYGSSAQVLTSNGSGSAPTWQAVPAPAALSTASGSAPSYSARAWVNFNGTGTVAIRAHGNVSSITDNGTGDYTVNYTTAMADANYAVSGTAGSVIAQTGLIGVLVNETRQATSSVRILASTNAGAFDASNISVAIFR